MQFSNLDYYVSSSVAGYRKPNCRGLQMISEKFAVPITDLIFVGDEEKDRKTALNANCKFIWIQRAEENEKSGTPFPGTAHTRCQMRYVKNVPQH